MTTRRDFLRSSALGAAIVAAAPRGAQGRDRLLDALVEAGRDKDGNEFVVRGCLLSADGEVLTWEGHPRALAIGAHEARVLAGAVHRRQYGELQAHGFFVGERRYVFLGEHEPGSIAAVAKREGKTSPPGLVARATPVGIAVATQTVTRWLGCTSQALWRFEQGLAGLV